MPRHIDVRELSVRYGEIAALRGVSLRVEQGEIVALVGANGAGKSTTLKALMGMVTPSAGAVAVDGDDVSGQPAHTAARRGIALVPEGRRIFTRMTVRENLQIGGVTRSRSELPGLMDTVFTLFPRIRERQQQLAGTLSGGEQQMLAIGRALMARPKVLLLDEPSMGLAPMVISQIFKIIAEINAQGTTVLLVEQNAQQALTRSDRAYILETGEITREGNARELLADDSIRAAYLGVA